MERWIRARPYLLPAIARLHGTHTEEDVFFAICRGDMTLWLGEKSAMVTELTQYPRFKVLNIFIAGGDLRELVGFTDRVFGFAKGAGCKRVQLTGRSGWERVLKDYTRAGMYLYKDL